MNWKQHGYRVGTNAKHIETIPQDADELDAFITEARRRIEPWLSAVFQAEHLNLLIGSGFTSAVAHIAKASITDMSKVQFGTSYDIKIDTHAEASAVKMGRGKANIEDQFRSALAVMEGLQVIDEDNAMLVKAAIDGQMKKLLDSLLKTEMGISSQTNMPAHEKAKIAVQSFLLSFASRTASRERLHVFTTNYDRLIEHGADLAGLRVVDRFVGTLNPIFRASRVEVDIHYNPPGIRGEPRFMEGVMRLTKLHGSLDWMYDEKNRQIYRKGIPFGASVKHTEVPKNPVDTVMIYPNPAKDVETTQYPYAELFRDFAASICRPNSVVVTYGYGFGDDHINRLIRDMLTIPSTHLVIIVYDIDDRVKRFCETTISAQVSVIYGHHFADLTVLNDNYLPKPALDSISSRQDDLLKRRSPTEKVESDKPSNAGNGF